MPLNYTNPVRYWSGNAPKTCDTCSGPIANVFTDGKTNRGPWAIMCPACLPRYFMPRDGKHGTGVGQQYTKQSDGRFMKTAG